MDNSLPALCEAIKKILAQLKPQSNPLSFIVLTGKNNQGKSSLLKQSKMLEVPVLSEQHAKIYFNQQGIVLELGEGWLNNSKNLLHNTLKQLNKCNRYLSITGIILCVDINELIHTEPLHFNDLKKSHMQILERFASNLGYSVELALIFTKMDTLAGFSEFYQNDHAADLAKPLGFSLNCVNQTKKKVEAYKRQFHVLLEQISQEVINKMHPARTTMKRSLIREFPLQLTSLDHPIQSLIQGITSKPFNLHSIYFTSAEQGGVSTDRLNKKIKHEYALVVQDTFPQATNYRAYFIEGAISTIQDQCSQAPQVRNISQKPLIAAAAGIASLSILMLFHSHYKTAHLLDAASKELMAYDTLSSQGVPGSQSLYHLSKAANKINRISSISLPTVYQLKHGLRINAQNRIQGEFLPAITNELEQVVNNPSNTPLTRYKALKIYLMLAQPEHLSKTEVVEWFSQQWGKDPAHPAGNQLALLNNVLSKPLQGLPINQQTISDARNYLNALPTSYLFYSLAKEYFPNTEENLSIEGFNLISTHLPSYFTKTGFNQIIKELPGISNKLQTENWVLARQDLTQLPDMLTQAYCFNYVTWWQTFMRKSQPLHYQDYEQGRQVTKILARSNSIAKIIDLVQSQTKPDLNQTDSLFNQQIANQFTELNLMSSSSAKELSVKIAELEQFIATLSVVNDGGRTAFNLTKSRFINESNSDPISLLFNQARQAPEPLKTWTNQIAGDTWVLLIKDTRQYINKQWQQSVYREFQNTIAHRYPFEPSQFDEIALADFNHFFATHGVINTFTEQYIKPFLDVSSAEWKPKVLNDFVLPISGDTLDAIIRANIITNMFFPDRSEETKIEFSLQKISLDPVVANLSVQIGNTKLTDTQSSESITQFTWPQNNASLNLDSIEGNHYKLAEEGTWAIFKLLEKVNVLVDEQDSSSLQILFEVNSNSGRYLLKTSNKVNPFTPGILNGFILNESLV